MVEVERARVADILDMRELHRTRMGCQIVHDSLHERGFTHLYLARVGREPIGYGTVVGFGDDPKDTVNELFVRTEHLAQASTVFRRVVEASGATRIQAQTNDPLLLLMVFDFGTQVRRDRILFEDRRTTSLDMPEVRFRAVSEDDAGRALDGSPVPESGSYVLETRRGEIVGAGGVLFHYNPPFGDLYMKVAERHRRRGYGTFLVQELKRVCRELGKVPAARCHAENVASRATLLAAGMAPCASILTATIDAVAIER